MCSLSLHEKGSNCFLCVFGLYSLYWCWEHIQVQRSCGVRQAVLWHGEVRRTFQAETVVESLTVTGYSFENFRDQSNLSSIFDSLFTYLVQSFQLKPRNPISWEASFTNFNGTGGYWQIKRALRTVQRHVEVVKIASIWEQLLTERLAYVMRQYFYLPRLYVEKFENHLKWCEKRKSRLEKFVITANACRRQIVGVSCSVETCPSACCKLLAESAFFRGYAKFFLIGGHQYDLEFTRRRRRRINRSCGTSSISELYSLFEISWIELSRRKLFIWLRRKLTELATFLYLLQN